jgi:hypothetical protein
MLPDGPVNSKYGAFASALFLQERGNGKLVFFGSSSENVRWRPGRLEGGERHRHRDRAQVAQDPRAGVTEGDVRNVAKEHHEDAIGAATNLPPGTIELRYVPELKQAFIDVMTEILTQSDTKITRVTFGDRALASITPKKWPTVGRAELSAGISTGLSTGLSRALFTDHTWLCTRITCTG